MKVARVGAWRLRSVFNDAALWQRHLDGELAEDRVRTGTPDPKNCQPPGTLSVAAYLIDESGRRIALVHYYLLPNGRINNAANQPDPKWFIVDDVRYILRVPRKVARKPTDKGPETRKPSG